MLIVRYIPQKLILFYIVKNLYIRKIIDIRNIDIRNNNYNISY
jgi:hypothetical protein